jgi:hypothetical protein
MTSSPPDVRHDRAIDTIPALSRALLVSLLVLAIGFGKDWATASAQADDINVAGIVIDYGNGERSYALVPFADETVSGIDLLHKSGLPLLTIEFGAMGEGVCVIEDTGCDLSACRARLCQTGDPESPFWQYVRSDGTGMWEFAALGASSSKVGDGDVDGWFWTGTKPHPEAVSLDDVASELDVNMEEYRTGAATSLEALAMTTGTSENEEEGIALRDMLAGAAIVGGLALVGGWAVWRARRMPAS